jgi:hypothetical protein
VVLDANDGNGATVQQSFTINIVVPVLSKNGEISFTNPNYVNKNGAVNTIFGLSATGAVIAVKDAPPAAAIGDLRDGGVVFWVDPEDNTHGLVCALSDYSIQVDWGCRGRDLPNVPNVAYNEGNPVGAGAEIGDGAPNTAGILADCTSEPAASATQENGPDWFLPSAKELNEIYINKVTLEAVSGVVVFSDYYWSSTESDNANGWWQNFYDGNQSDNSRNDRINVRAVRAF